jgi:hypothetical protein
MIRRYNSGLGLALLVLIALPGQCFAGTIFNFDYSLPSFLGSTDPPLQGISTDTYSASGSLTADLDPFGSGNYIVSDIQGTRTVDGVVMQITGLLDPGTFDGNTNVLYFTNLNLGGLLDSGGISFTVDNAALSNDGAGDVNLFYDAFGQPFFEPNATGAYIEAGGSAYGTFDATLDPPVPEPSAAILLFGGLVAIVCSTRRR